MDKPIKLELLLRKMIRSLAVNERDGARFILEHIDEAKNIAEEVADSSTDPCREPHSK